MADVPGKGNQSQASPAGFLTQALDRVHQGSLERQASGKPSQIQQISVLIITGRSDWGLAPRNALEIIKTLEPAGFKFIVAAPNEPPHGTEFRKFADHFIAIQKDEFSFRDLRRLYKVTQRMRPSVIHSHGRIGGFYSRILRVLTGIKVIHSFHGIAKRPGLKGKIYSALEQLLASTDFVAVFSSSSEATQALQAQVLLPKRPQVIIERSVNLKAIPKRKVPAFSSAPPKIGGIVRTGAASGGDLFLKLAKECESQGAWSCTGLSTETLATLGSVPKNLNNQGPQNDPIPWLQTIDIYINTSRAEGAANGVLEALASGCVCVLSDIPAHKPFSGAHAALLFNPNEPATLTKALSELRADIGLRNSLISNGQYFVERFHNSEVFYDSMIELYRTSIRGW